MLHILQNSGSAFFQWIIETVKYYFPGVSPDTVFSVLVSVGIFSFGWFLTVLYEKWKESKRLKERARFLKGSIESILISVERQKQEYEELSEKLLDLKERFFSLNLVTYLNLSFYSPNLIEDIHRFLEKHEGDSFQIVKSLSGTINGINVQVDHSKSNILKFTENSKELEREWVQAVDQIFRYYDRLAEDIRNGLEPDDFHKGFSTILQNWVQNRDDADTKALYENLIEPLITLCEDSIPHNDARAILPLASRAKYTYENIVTNRKRYKDLFGYDAKQIRDYGKTLSILTDIIDENLKWHRRISKYFTKQDSAYLKLVENEKKNNKDEEVKEK